MTATASPPSQLSESVFDAAADALQSEAVVHHPKLREAIALVEARKFGAAAAILQEFRKAHPRSAEALLNLFPKLASDNGFLLTRMALFAVANLTDIKRVGEQFV